MISVELTTIRQARTLVADLFVYRPLHYWLDLSLTLAIGYGAALIYLGSPIFSLVQVAAFVISGFALFRAGSFVHEIAHLRRGQMEVFCVV